MTPAPTTTDPRQETVVLGVQGAQIVGNTVRGIARYIREQTSALCRNHTDRIAQLAVDPSMPLPGSLERVPTQIPIAPTSDRPVGRPAVYHVMSPFEGLSLERIWPRWARDPSVGLVVTLYDLIPLIHRDQYFHGPLRRLLRARYELVRSADAVVAISQHTADDAVAYLGVAPDHVHSILGGCSEFFQPAVDRASAFASLSDDLPRLEPDFFFFAGNTDPRKNNVGLLQGYALLPADLRDRHHLVITASQTNSTELRRLEGIADELGVGATTHIRGFVSDETLLALYQTCLLFIFPSFYEGLGLPVIEAMSCGAAAAAGDNSSLREIVEREDARFDPYSSMSIAGILHRAATDPEWISALRGGACERAGRFTWDLVASRTIAAYDEVMARRR